MFSEDISDLSPSPLQPAQKIKVQFILPRRDILQHTITIRCSKNKYKNWQ
jgi:hypothetical protein